MSYTVLARRYRSSTFDEVVGQDHVAQTLKRAIESDRVAHAYLFCGTRGVGKTSMARIFAKAMNCDKSKGPTTKPCGECESCKAIARGDDMDVIEIDAASNTGVDNVRDIIDNARYRPARARFKIYIIDEVHMLSKGAFNALLKLLEEPPAHVKFVLATTEPEKVLATILSRCQRYDFRNISTKEIAAHLADVCKKEKVKADEDALLLIAKTGAGSMRDALSLLDRVLSLGESKITVQLLQQMLGMPRSQAIFELAQALGEASPSAVLEKVDALLREGLSLDTLISSLSDHLRNLLVLRTCGKSSGLVEVPGIPLDDLDAQANRFEAATLSQDIAILEELRRQMRSSSASRSLLDATLVRLALAEQFSPVDAEIAAASSPAASAVKKKFPVSDASAAQAVPLRARDDIAPVAAAPRASDDAGASVPATGSSDADAGSGDDALPAVGKVWEAGSAGLAEALRARSGSTPTASASNRDSAGTANGKHSATRSSEAVAVMDENIEPVPTDDLARVWSTLLEQLGSRHPVLPALLQEARLVGIESDQAIVQYPHESAAVVRNLENGRKDVIAGILRSITRTNLTVRLTIADPPEPGASTAKVRPEPPTQRSDRLSKPSKNADAEDDGEQTAVTAAARVPRASEGEKQEMLDNDPLVRAVAEHLDGEIVRIE